MIILKIQALIGRSQTQARDVFDLDLLFQQYPQLTRDEVTPRERIDIDAAIERAIELPFDAYESQVVPFLAPDFVEMLGSAAAWAQMQEHVVDVLNRLR